ncbi:MAG: bifunctional phosphoribosylaminoimidazolecarboxamide formyltransferase/IMP cyclohydrolase [Saprospiraceae bacterium]
MMNKKINSVLISVFDKSGLNDLIELFKKNNTKVISTGGTYEFLSANGLNPIKVEDLTKFPSMLDGRVKTLHPAVFGGILAIRNEDHLSQLEQYDIPTIDMVIVDLYPFEKTVASSDDADEIIEKIDIGGISLIRAAAKNFKDVLVVPSQEYYKEACDVLSQGEMTTTEEDRKRFAKYSFSVSSHYDTHIYKYFSNDEFPDFTASLPYKSELRYGENSHQKAAFYGKLEDVFDKLNGKEISYNNLVDIDAAVELLEDVKNGKPCFAILKHTNPCGVAYGENGLDAWTKALKSDPVSAFGGILITNSNINLKLAKEIDSIFYEVLIAPQFDEDALALLSKKKNRILLKIKDFKHQSLSFKNILNGFVVQEKDKGTFEHEEFNLVTTEVVAENVKEDLLFANIIVKHLKSNAIALVKDSQLIGIGHGQTSRVDACRQSIDKAQRMGFDTNGAVMASDAFFPFPDSIEIAHEAGIVSVIQPGGSVNDNLSIDYCNKNGVSMVFTGYRHFRH